MVIYCLQDMSQKVTSASSRCYIPRLLMLTSIVAVLTCTNTSVLADIVELPPEQMTESYIQDTTVIIRKPINNDAVNTASSKPKRAAALKVSPIDFQAEQEDTIQEQIFNEENNRLLTEQDRLSSSRRELTDFILVPFSPPQFYGNKAENDQLIRDALNLPDNAVIDYQELVFPTLQQSDERTSSTASTSPTQFQLVVPNSRNIDPQNFATPKGELDVNITPDNITLNFNLPN